MNGVSGDQKGCMARSVLFSGRAVAESSARTHKRDCASDAATNATIRLAGEMAIEIGTVGRGVAISRRTSAAVAGGGRKSHAAAAATIAATAPVTARTATHDRLRRSVG